jgi:hypothetical protein
MKQRDEQKLANDQIIDVRYADLTRDPVGTVSVLYERWGMPFKQEIAERIRRRLTEQKHGQGGGHRYSFAETGLDRAEQREKFTKYLQRYDVAAEE